MAGKAWARRTLLAALSLCAVFGTAQPALGAGYGGLYWTMGTRAPLHNSSYFTHGTAGSLHTASNTIDESKVSAILVDRDWDWYVEAGWVKSKIKIDGVTRNYTSFMAWSQPGWLSQQRYWKPGPPEAQGEWRYYELNRFARSGSNYNWRANLAGVTVTHVWTTLLHGTSAVVGERRSTKDTNYTRAQNMCYRGTNGSWYMFNMLQIYPHSVDPDYYGHWGSWYSGKRDFQVNKTP